MSAGRNNQSSSNLENAGNASNASHQQTSQKAYSAPTLQPLHQQSTPSVKEIKTDPYFPAIIGSQKVYPYHLDNHKLDVK